MMRRPRRSTLLPYTTLFRADDRARRFDRIARARRRREAMADADPSPALVVAEAAHAGTLAHVDRGSVRDPDRKSTRLNSSHANISYAVFCLKKKNMPSYKRT